MNYTLVIKEHLQKQLVLRLLLWKMLLVLEMETHLLK